MTKLKFICKKCNKEYNSGITHDGLPIYTRCCTCRKKKTGVFGSTAPKGGASRNIKD